MRPLLICHNPASNYLDRTLQIPAVSCTIEVYRSNRRRQLIPRKNSIGYGVDDIKSVATLYIARAVPA